MCVCPLSSTFSTMSKSVKQSDLRKLMHQASSSSSSSSLSAKTSKKYKVSARELALIEEQKQRKRQERELRQPSQPKAPALPQGFFDAQPAKGILKNSKRPAQQSLPATTETERASEAKRVRLTTTQEPTKVSSSTAATDVKHADSSGGGGGDGGALPEGFFDDPKQDAKVCEVSFLSTSSK